MYIPRTAEDAVKRLSREFKILLLTGAPGVGKTTLLRHCDSAREYVTLQNLFEREMAINDPQGFLAKHKAPVIIEEIDLAPNLLSFIKLATSETEKKGAYWLTSTQEFSTMRGVPVSLTGCVGLLNLMGLSQAELARNPKKEPFFPSKKLTKGKSLNPTRSEIFKRIFTGSFPALNEAGCTIDREAFYNDYLLRFIDDARLHLGVTDALLFFKFIQILATKTANPLKYADLATAVGITEPTAKKWLSFLVAADLVFFLPACVANTKRRMTKMPKLYFCDTGLCAYLTRWPNAKTLESGAMNEAFFETYVVSEILKTYRHHGKRPPLYWYRDAEQREIDLIFEGNGKMHPVEITLNQTPNRLITKDFKLIKNAGFGCVICPISVAYSITDNASAIPVTSVF